MKQSLPYFLALALAVALMPAKTFSQQINDKQVDEASCQRAYTLLESLAEQIGSLRSGENRARMGSNIAGSLWPHNEAKAREMFARVTREIKAGLQGNDKDPDRYLARPNFMKLREDTALRIGMFDPEWALQFLNETSPIDVYVSDKEQSELNLRLAMVSAGRNPDVALRLGRESLKNGILESQLSLVYILSKKSRNHASALFAEIVKRVSYQNIRSDIKNEQFFYMLARLVEPSLGRDPAFRDLMNYFTDVALKAGCGLKTPKDNDGFCYRLGLVVPLMEKVDAKRVAPMKHLARRAAFPYESSAGLFAYADVYQNGSVDDLRAMPTYPDFPELRQLILIRKVTDSGDFAGARKLVDEFTWEGASKQEVLKQLDHEQRIANEDTSAEILKQAEGFGEIETFYYLFWMATEIGTKNRQTTLKLLDRASELLGKVSPERQQMQYQVGIAAKYCQVKSDRCFTMMEPIIRKMNDLVNSATSLNGVDNSYLRNGEWNMTAEGGVGSLLTGLAQNAVYFALCDFDRAMALSSQFERREIRMMAQLKLAQGLLAGPPKKALFPEQEY
jgi:hypothetical protein